MNELTLKELKSVNNLTVKYKVGTKVQEIINRVKLISVNAAPVNAVASARILTLTGVVVHGETITIDDPAILGVDVYEFLTDAAQVKTLTTNLAVNIGASAVKATGTFTLAVPALSGETLTLGTKVFTFVPVGTATANGEVSIGADLPAAKLALVAAINGTDGWNTPHPLARASIFVANVTTITALIGGTVGNSIATTETIVNAGNLFAAVTLLTGANCSAANAIIALVALMGTNVVTQRVVGTSGGGDTVVMTAVIRGAAGNLVVIGETLLNGSFAGGAIVLAGGIDGTSGFKHELRSDATYLYVCTQVNTISGNNWRRIAVGNLY